MPTINTKQAGASLRINQFGGIDRRCTTFDIDNLRLCADGSLMRRCGYAPALTLPDDVRGVWSGSFAGTYTTFAVAGDKLYQLDLDAGTYSEVGTVAAGDDRVALFLYRGKLLCLDGSNILIYDGSTLSTASTYVPLVSYERGPFDQHNIYEPLNLIDRRARFTFRGTGENTLYYFGLNLESITNVYNISSGSIVAPTKFTLGRANNNSYIAFNYTPDAGDIILVNAKLSSEYYQYAALSACRTAVVYGASYDDRILCWDGNTASEMFCSQPVSTMQRKQASSWEITSGDLYFPLDCNFLVGDGQYDIRAACRHYDRLLVFTEGNTWMADFASHFTLNPINSGIGCTAPGAAALAGNTPLTVANGGIWRWTSNALRRDECSATCISEGIADLLGAQFSQKAIAYSCRERNEVWFADPSDEAGCIFVYHTVLDAWYRFSGIRADGFFSHNNDIGFWRGRSFFCFDEARQTDLDADGEHTIAVKLTLDKLTFAEIERLNHLTRLALRLHGNYPPLTLTLETDLGRVQTIHLAEGGEADADTLIDRPARSGRFRALRLTLTASDGPRLHLRGLALTAEPGKHDEA